MTQWSNADETFEGLTVKKKSTAWSGITQSVQVKAGLDYTLSAWIKCSEGAKIIFYGENTNRNDTNVTDMCGTDWCRVHMTFSPYADGECKPRFENTIEGETMYICGLKLERGNIASDWSPAPTIEEIGALPLTGGTLSGDLYANGFYVNSLSIYPSVTFSGTVDEELEKFGMVEFHENHRGSIVSEMQDGSYKEYYQFPRPADTGTENAYYDVLTTKNPSESLAKLGGLPLTGGTLSGDLKLTSGTNQRKINIYRNIGDSQYELQHSINYEGKGFLGVYKNSKEVNMIKLGENSTEFSKPITVSGGATGDVAA